MADDDDSAAHHPIGPSGADRWATCTASVKLIESLGDEADDETEWAAEGDFLHAVAAECLEFGIPASMMIGRTREWRGKVFEVTDALAADMQSGLDFLDERPGDLEVVETRVNLSGVYPGMFGTLDVGRVKAGAAPRLTIFDWKWGAGVPVSPVENRQMTLYGKGFYDHAGPLLRDAAAWGSRDTPVDFIIWQPRIPGAGGEWTTTLGWVLDRAAELGAKAAEAAEGRGVFAPSEKACRFCPAARLDRCDARASWLLKSIGLAFDNVEGELDDPEGMTTAKRVAIWRRAPEFKKWLTEVGARLLADAQGVGDLGGVKAVEGPGGDRKWADEDSAEKFLRRVLGEKAVKTKLRTPPDVEKEIPPSEAETFKSLVTRAPSQPILVESTDPRPAIRPVWTQFEDVT